MVLKDRGKGWRRKQTEEERSTVNGLRGGCCSIERLSIPPEARTTRSRCCNPPNIHPNPSHSCLLYVTLELDYTASKALQHSWKALVFAPSSMVPLCFVFQAKYRKSLLSSALSKETYLFPRIPSLLPPSLNFHPITSLVWFE